MKSVLFLSLAIATIGFANTATAQSLSPVVVASAGATASVGNTQISYTVGESVIPTLYAGNTYLTQGFQQPSWIEVGISEVGVEGIKVFPNPTAEVVTIETGNHKYNVALYDMLGQIVIESSEIKGSAQLDLSTLAPATYALVLKNKFKSHSISLVKTN
ncbi:MAG: T9SS type A sorting domain-containing protein [Chitinophagales bacterium]|nr:T9SS type A sorting domain-containing protein [Chitinophagales bacterium]MCO5279817.1 T9SS type A sorting domain-containing protein [Chitinophagales bacterium]OJV30512.1 MAG: hypothetical protein BGO32_08980 [Bacteroidetes bacterium 37-13]HRN93189.1 T9SS type A sorting domain-containing protein [Chitinophagales bacterium]HRP38820.1 T9SS type A sorting domain-containing protein [Chitinophagales bacterium]